MQSPAQEAIAQIMFWMGMGSLPAFFAFTIMGFRCRKLQRAAGMFCIAILGLNHFVWYFNVLGGSLATKVGTYEPPSWSIFLPYTGSVFALLCALWLITKRRKANEPQPPTFPKQ